MHAAHPTTMQSYIALDMRCLDDLTSVICLHTVGDTLEAQVCTFKDLDV